MKTLRFQLYRVWVFFGRLADKAKGKETEKNGQLSQASDRDSEWDTINGPKAEDSLSSEDRHQPEGRLEPALHRLNDDVLYYLANYILSLDDTVAFALTCRAAYKAIGGRRVLQMLNKEPAWYRARFLERLEFDFPKHVLCYECDMQKIANHYRLGPLYGRNELYLVPQAPYFRRDIERKIAHAHGFNEEKLAREMLPLCYRCEICGAERQFTITYLASKPGYAVIRSAMWESVGHCENSVNGQWEHICSSGSPATVLPFLSISQSELIHQRACIEEIPGNFAQRLNDEVVQKLTY
ncbi:hypothetical protein TRV_00905 [Trichophyton verrucosum HKI 0517]|uniref:Uncharacterized protein n=1 Tax=Trichophyton verrucosum (strain HKI 0517) TaxID=663202 RepID=D4D1F5_TRIVH|nr:uncharacterized protein TRV_00905 [Trichophyton verrucosum HKI 0517]EFE44289.1 hypothetical protein TRV_00905 [Trichophyton verrucosum HKI 0517]